MPDKDTIERLRSLIKSLMERSGTGKESSGHAFTFSREAGCTGESTRPAAFEPPGQTSVIIEEGSGIKVIRTVYPISGHVPPPLSDDALAALRAIQPEVPPAEEWLFLDIETTGLLGAATFPFLVGLGRWEEESFSVVQYFLAARDEESTFLRKVMDEVLRWECVVTYNGKSFDIPLLNGRLVMCRAATFLSPACHLDLLHLARALGKRPGYGHSLKDSVRRLFGIIRPGDIPGHLIPDMYFLYEREGNETVLAPVFSHNRLDIVDMARLISAVAGMLNGEYGPSFDRVAMGSIGKLHFRKGNLEFARRCLLAASTPAVPFDETPKEYELRFRRALAAVARRQGDWETAGSILLKIVSSGNGTPEDYLWLSRYYELYHRDTRAAKKVVDEAISRLVSLGAPVPEALRSRKRRLDKLCV